MRIPFLLFIAVTLLPAATLTVTPAFNADCTLGLGTATVTWSGATGPVQILVGQPAGPPLTAFTTPSGSAATGPWVTEGMAFYLVNQAGAAEASAIAHLSCGGTPRTIDQGLTGGSYFPLAVGNTWVYKHNSRFVTADYIVYTITGTQTVAGQSYFVLTASEQGAPFTVALLRSGAGGVIYQNTSKGDVVYIDPNAAGAQHIGYSGPLGTFHDAVTNPAAPVGALAKTTYVYVRGIGLVNYNSVDVTGSNGGFLDGVDLIDARVDGIHISIPAPKIGLSIEARDLDLTNRLVPNCAVPCYYAACGIGSPYDLPGVYRPCAQTRIDTSSAAPGYTVLLQLLDSTGTAVFTNSTAATTASTLNYIRVPLYMNTGVFNPPFTLLPPGDYKLVGSLVNGANTEATSSITVHIH